MTQLELSYSTHAERLLLARKALTPLRSSLESSGGANSRPPLRVLIWCGLIMVGMSGHPPRVLHQISLPDLRR